MREEFWKNVKVAGQTRSLTRTWNTPGAWPTFWSLPNCSCLDALHRNESCGGHFRTEYQTDDGEAKRDDENFAYVAAWEYAGPGQAAHPATRNRWFMKKCT